MRFLVILALLPAVLLTVYIYKKDRLEREPVRLIVRLLALGAFSCLPAAAMEYGVGALIDSSGIANPYFLVFLNSFAVAALCEELVKYFFLRRTTWRSAAFDYQFDAIVYGVSVSLGFAALENVMYVMQSGFETGLLRAVTSVPGHAIFGVFMGCHYGLARSAHEWGDSRTENRELFRAMLVPVLLHGFYDFCLTMDSGVFLVIYFVFEIIVTITAFKTVKRLSNEDRML